MLPSLLLLKFPLNSRSLVAAPAFERIGCAPGVAGNGKFPIRIVRRLARLAQSRARVARRLARVAALRAGLTCGLGRVARLIGCLAQRVASLAKPTAGSTNLRGRQWELHDRVSHPGARVVAIDRRVARPIRCGRRGLASEWLALASSARRVQPGAPSVNRR